MQKDDLHVYVFQNRNWCSPKSDSLFFFYLWLSEDSAIERILSEKDMGVRDYFLKKWKLCMHNLTKERKEPPVSIL